MPGWIEDYAMIGDMQTAVLVGRDSSMDWACLPDFDSAACFAALLGDEQNGCWTMRPAEGDPRATRRRYRGQTLILESEWDTDTGTVRVIDFMPPRGGTPHVVRIVEGVSGSVRMETDLRLRFDYGHVVPWVHRAGTELVAIAGPDAVWLSTPVPLQGHNFTHDATFTVTAGQRVPFVMTWHPSQVIESDHLDAEKALSRTERFWENWVDQCTYNGPHRKAVIRSLITLKALTYRPTGGIVAAPTTSLPEEIGGVRNWDYRYCWLRDATITLEALIRSGYKDEAMAWREWLVRAVAGEPQLMQIMYGIRGERRLTEWEADWLPGYENSRPVRIGNAAVGQYQLDVRRGHGRFAPGSPVRHQWQRLPVGPAALPGQLPGVVLGRARRGPVGGPRPTSALRALQGDGLGGCRPCGTQHRGIRQGGPHRTVVGPA